MADLKALGVQVVEAMAANDAAGMRRLMADDIVWRYPESSRLAGLDPVRQGVDQVIAGVGRSLSETFRSLSPRIDLVLSDGDHAVVLCMLHGQTSAGRPYDNRYVFVMRFEGERVAEAWEVVDTAQAFALISGQAA